MKLVVAPAAAHDLQRLHSFLTDIDRAAAARASAILRFSIQRLLDFPQRGRPSGLAGVRELIVPFGRAAYIVRYAYFAERDEVVALRIWHSREERD